MWHPCEFNGLEAPQKETQKPQDGWSLHLALLSPYAAWTPITKAHKQLYRNCLSIVAPEIRKGKLHGWVFLQLLSEHRTIQCRMLGKAACFK